MEPGKCRNSHHFFPPYLNPDGDLMGGSAPGSLSVPSDASGNISPFGLRLLPEGRGLHQEGSVPH